MRIEQAVFTSIRGPRLAGYQLAARSPGISEALAQELTAWGPAHDSLWESRQDSRSINFHPLSTGDYCLSVTVVAGAEYSGRGGGRVYTQMFLLPAAALARFANDPFLVVRGLAASGRLVVFDQLPEELPTVPLVGKSVPPADLLAQPTIQELGLQALDDIAQALAISPAVAVVTSQPIELIFQALLHTLSDDARLALSFTTGLKESPRRPFKLLHLPSDPSIVRQSQRLSGCKVVDFSEQVRGSSCHGHALERS